MVKLWPVRVNDMSGSSSRLLHSTVYCPLKPFFAPISLLLRDVRLQPKKEKTYTYSSSARVAGSAMSDVPVSRMTPVLSSSAVASPNEIASRSTSQ